MKDSTVLKRIEQFNSRRAALKTGGIWLMKKDATKVVRLGEEFEKGFAFFYRNLYGREVKGNSIISNRRLLNGFDPFLV